MQVIHEITIQGHPISIMQSTEGDIFCAYETPEPSPEKRERIENYLRQEGLLPTTEPPSATSTPKIVVIYLDGSTETFSLYRSEILAYDPSHHEATIAIEGRVLCLHNVEKIETHEE